MKAFSFPLERVLDWRRTELEQAEVRFKQQAAVLAELDRRRAEMEAADLRAEMQVRAWRPVSGGDLTALGAFQKATQKRQQQLLVQRDGCRKELGERQKLMMEARRRLRLLERLRESRLEQWRMDCDREVEMEAAEAYLARWGK